MCRKSICTVEMDLSQPCDQWEAYIVHLGLQVTEYATHGLLNFEASEQISQASVRWLPDLQGGAGLNTHGTVYQILLIAEICGESWALRYFVAAIVHALGVGLRVSYSKLMIGGSMMGKKVFQRRSYGTVFNGWILPPCLWVYAEDGNL